MHYRNGREAKNGDLILQISFDRKINAFGVLFNAMPGNDYCNGSIAPAQVPNLGAVLCDCLHIEDVMAVLAEKGLANRPEGM